MRLPLFCFVTSLSLANLAPAQPTPPTPPVATLHAGMPAPEFKVEQFIKGKPFQSFAKGHVYVVEFWATWCGPCVMSMPHLSELQHQYKDTVTICGVNVWQDKEYTPTTLETVTKFVQKKGDTMDYTVAFDGAAKHMDTAWLKAANQQGIPASFVIDKSGQIAWIGHPAMLDIVLEGVTEGTWDAATGPARLEAAAKAFADAGAKYFESIAAGDAAWNDAVRRYPAMGRVRANQRLGAVLASGHAAEAAAIGAKIIEDARRAKNPAPITGVLEALADPATLKEAPAKELLLKAAQANLELADPTEPGAHVVLARAFFLNDQPEKGRVESATALTLAPEASRASMEKWLKELEESSAKK